MKHIPFFEKTLFTSLWLILACSTWAHSSEWNFSINRGTSTPFSTSSPNASAHLQGTDEGLLVISTLDPEAPITASVGFSECHYPVDLKYFTESLMIQANHLIKSQRKDYAGSPKWKSEILLDAEDESDFGNTLAFLLSQSGYDGIVIEDIENKHHCHASHDHAVLALSHDKIHPKTVFLTKEGSPERISLYDWAWQEIEKTWRKSELEKGQYEPLRLIQQVFDWLKNQGVYTPSCPH